MKFHLTLDGKNAACGAVTNRPDTFLYDKSGFAGHYASEYRCKKCEKIFNEMKKYDTVDYEDARSHLTGVFDSRNNPKLKDASFTKEDVEGLAVILHDLRQKHDDPLDVWESNAVSDYTSNLESSYEMKMEKGGKSGFWDRLFGSEKRQEVPARYINKSELSLSAKEKELANSQKERDGYSDIEFMRFIQQSKINRDSIRSADYQRVIVRHVSKELGIPEKYEWRLYNHLAGYLDTPYEMQEDGTLGRYRAGYEKGGKTGAKKEKSSGGEKIEGYLPIFTGFYETIFKADEDMVIESPYKYDDYDFDYEAYEQDMSKACVDVVEKWLENFDIKIKFQGLYSPREYNFSNDSINVEYTIGKNTVKEILDYLEITKDAFAKYIKERYTSRDGFISSYSNDSAEWINDLKSGNKLHHVFGSVLEFILKEEGHDDYELYEQASGSAFLMGTLKKEIVDNLDYIIEYTKEHYKNKSQDEIAEDVMKHFNNEGIDYSEKTVRKIIKETFSEVEDKSMKMFEKGGKTGKEKSGWKLISDAGDQKYYVRDFGYVEIDKKIPLVLVIHIIDLIESGAINESELPDKDKPVQVYTYILPELKYISKKIKNNADESGTGADYEGIASYMGGVPLNMDELTYTFENIKNAEFFWTKSEEIKKKLDAYSGVMIGFVMDKAVNRIGNTGWDIINFTIGKTDKMFARGGKIMSGLKSFFESYSNDGGLVFGGYFGGGNKMEKGGRASKDGDRHTYYIKAWKKEESYNEKKKPDLEEKKSLNWDEAHERQMNLEERFYAVGIFAKKDNREVSISLGEVMSKGGKAKV